MRNHYDGAASLACFRHRHPSFDPADAQNGFVGWLEQGDFARDGGAG